MPLRREHRPGRGVERALAGREHEPVARGRRRSSRSCRRRSARTRSRWPPGPCRRLAAPCRARRAARARCPRRPGPARARRCRAGCAPDRVRVAAGIAFCWTHSTGSPDFAAHPAAGIAYSGVSADATTTVLEGSPADLGRQAVDRRGRASRSRRPRRRWSSAPAGAPAAPTLIACAPSSGPGPGRRQRSSAALVASGSSPPSVSSTGARTGGLDSWAAEVATRAVAAVGERRPPSGACPRLRDGNTAIATPAASATGSPPPTRVVFFVAKPGKPSAARPASASSPFWPRTGRVSVAPPLSSPLDPPPHPASAMAASTRIARLRGEEEGTSPRLATGRAEPRFRPPFVVNGLKKVSTASDQGGTSTENVVGCRTSRIHGPEARGTGDPMHQLGRESPCWVLGRITLLSNVKRRLFPR